MGYGSLCSTASALLIMRGLACLKTILLAFATVGLSTGVTADLSDAGKYVIVFTMYLGRVGVLLFMAALLGDPEPSSIQYPEEELLVG